MKLKYNQSLEKRFAKWFVKLSTGKWIFRKHYYVLHECYEDEFDIGGGMRGFQTVWRETAKLSENAGLLYEAQ